MSDNLRKALALAAYGALAVVMTLPLALRAGDSLLGTDSNALNDSYFSVWIFGWQARQLIADPFNLFHGNIFFPFQNTLAFSEIILPGALAFLPLAYATANPILAYNFVVIASFALNGFAMYLCALEWFRLYPLSTHLPGSSAPKQSTPSGSSAIHLSSFIAGLIFAFSAYKMGEIRHVQLLLAMFMPLTLMYCARLVRAPNFGNAFLCGLFFALNALASLYYAVFLALALVLYAVVDFLVRRYRLTRAHLVYAVLAALVASALLLPFVVPFLQVERQYGFSAGRDPRLFSARPASYLASVTTQWLYGNLTREYYVASKGQPLFPGIAALALALVGLLILIRRRNPAWIFLLLLALMGFILSFGPVLLLGRATVPALPIYLPFHYLSLILTPLKSLNAPARFAVLTMLALALLAAYGAARLIKAQPSRRSALVAIVFGLVILLEYIPVPLRLVPVAAGAAVPPVYTYLASQPRGQPVVEMPMGAPTFADQDRYVVYTYNAIYHWQPLVNGYSTFIPPEYYAFVKEMQSFPSARTVRLLRQWGVKWVIVHSERYPDAAVLRRNLDSLRRLVHERDFGETWLYRIQ